jgi:hypothetical protein
VSTLRGAACSTSASAPVHRIDEGTTALTPQPTMRGMPVEGSNIMAAETDHAAPRPGPQRGADNTAAAYLSRAATGTGDRGELPCLAWLPSISAL